MDVLKCEPIDADDLVQIVAGTRAQLDKVMKWFHIAKDPKPPQPSPIPGPVPRGEAEVEVASSSAEEEGNDQVDIANMVMSVVNSLQAQNPNIRVQFLGAHDRGTHTDFTVAGAAGHHELEPVGGRIDLGIVIGPAAAGSFQGVPSSGQGHRLD